MRFVALTPNLALDRTLELAQPLTSGELHRVGRLREVAGGKGVNVARVLKTLGADVHVAGFLAGFNGQKFRRLLEDEGLTGTFAELEGETRECHILLDAQGHPTEVYEQGPTVTPDDWRTLVARLPKGRLIISGSLPQGISPDDFRALLRELPSKPVVDASGRALLSALEAGVALVKPNLAELKSVCPLFNDPLGAAHSLYDSYSVPILLTLGPDGAAYVAEETQVVPAPKLAAVNPVASGDSLIAAFLWARAEGWTLEKALRLGVAAGAENAVCGGGARFSKEGLMGRFERLNQA